MRTKRSRKTSKRTIVEPRKADRRYVRRSKTGQFKKEVNVGRSLAADRRRKAKTKAAKGQGDRGDANRRARDDSLPARISETTARASSVLLRAE
jgi:hypothetical protein